jgi:hypothetical protein
MATNRDSDEELFDHDIHFNLNLPSNNELDNFDESDDVVYYELPSPPTDPSFNTHIEALEMINKFTRDMDNLKKWVRNYFILKP